MADQIDTVRTDVVVGPALVLPGVSLVFCVIIAVLPWGLPSSARFVLPMLPYAAVHYWTLNGRGVLPAPCIALAGLAIDFITHGPLGFWSFIFLFGHMLALVLSGPLSATPTLRFVGYLFTIGILAVLTWLAASFYFVMWVDIDPFVFALLPTALFYPALSLFLFRPTSPKTVE